MPITENTVYAFERALLALDRLQVSRILEELSADHTPIQLMEELVAPPLEHIGEGWEQGRVALSQVYMSGRICEELVDSLLPPSEFPRKNQPKMAIAVLEDHHVLGKRIVYSAIRASGFELLDFGHGVTVDELYNRCVNEKVEILLISVLMLPSALLVKDVSAKLKAWNKDIKVVVGGAPFRLDERLGTDIQADEVGFNSGDAVRIVSRLSGEAS